MALHNLSYERKSFCEVKARPLDVLHHPSIIINHASGKRRHYLHNTNFIAHNMSSSAIGDPDNGRIIGNRLGCG